MEDGNEGSASRRSVPLGHVQLGHWSPEERLLLLRPNLGKYHHAGWMPPQSRTFCRAKKVVTRTLRLAPLSAAAITIREAAQGERGPAHRGAWERHPVSIRALGTEHSHCPPGLRVVQRRLGQDWHEFWVAVTIHGSSAPLIGNWNWKTRISHIPLQLECRHKACFQQPDLGHPLSPSLWRALWKGAQSRRPS